MTSPATLTLRMDRTLPGLADFWMAGQWVQPGGGVPTAVISGRQVIQLICHGEGRAFAATEA